MILVHTRAESFYFMFVCCTRKRCATARRDSCCDLKSQCKTFIRRAKLKNVEIEEKEVEIATRLTTTKFMNQQLCPHVHYGTF